MALKKLVEASKYNINSTNHLSARDNRVCINFCSLQKRSNSLSVRTSMVCIFDRVFKDRTLQNYMETCLRSNVISVAGWYQLIIQCPIKYITKTVPRQFIRNFATKSVGKKSLDTVCRSEQIGGRPCRGRMHDTILDWEHNLPDSDLTLSDLHSR